MASKVLYILSRYWMLGASVFRLWAYYGNFSFTVCQQLVHWVVSRSGNRYAWKGLIRYQLQVAVPGGSNSASSRTPLKGRKLTF
jgi:hypothetical protein